MSDLSVRLLEENTALRAKCEGLAGEYQLWKNDAEAYIADLKQQLAAVTQERDLARAGWNAAVEDLGAQRDRLQEALKAALLGYDKWQDAARAALEEP